MSSKRSISLHLLLVFLSLNYAISNVNSRLWPNYSNKCIFVDKQNGVRFLSHMNCYSILKARFQVSTTDSHVSFVLDAEGKANDGARISYEFGNCELEFQTHSKDDGQKWIQLTRINTYDALNQNYKFLSQVQIDLKEDKIEIKGNENEPDVSHECKSFSLFGTIQKEFSFEQQILEGPTNLVLKIDSQNYETFNLIENPDDKDLATESSTTLPVSSTASPESSTALSSFAPATLAPREDFNPSKECINNIKSSSIWQVDSGGECKRPFRAIFRQSSNKLFACRAFKVSAEYDQVGNNSRIQYKIGNCAVNVTIQKVDGKVRFYLPDHKVSFDSNFIIDISLVHLNICDSDHHNCEPTVFGCAKAPLFRELVFEQHVIEGEPNTTFQFDCEADDWDLTCASGFNNSNDNACLPGPEENLILSMPKGLKLPGEWEWSKNGSLRDQKPVYKPLQDQKDNILKPAETAKKLETTSTSTNDSSSYDDERVGILNTILAIVFLMVLLSSFIACGIACCLRKDRNQYVSANQYASGNQYASQTYYARQEYIDVNGQQTPIVRV